MTRSTHKHKIYFENIIIVMTKLMITKKYSFSIEPWFSQRNPNAGIHIPEIYKSLYLSINLHNFELIK